MTLEPFADILLGSGVSRPDTDHRPRKRQRTRAPSAWVRDLVHMYTDIEDDRTSDWSTEACAEIVRRADDLSRGAATTAARVASVLLAFKIVAGYDHLYVYGPPRRPANESLLQFVGRTRGVCARELHVAEMAVHASRWRQVDMH